MHEGPRLKDTQLKHLRDLIAKRGWNEADFAQAARTPVEALTPAQAREWITKLTKATKGKPRATPRPTPEVVSTVHHRKKQTPIVPDLVGEAELEGVEDAG